MKLGFEDRLGCGDCPSGTAARRKITSESRLIHNSPVRSADPFGRAV